MSIYRRASLQQERLEYNRRRSSLSAPCHRRYSAANVSRSRLNSVNAIDIHETIVCHPPAEELCQLIPGLPDHISFEPTLVPPPSMPPRNPMRTSKETPLEAVQEQEEEKDDQDTMDKRIFIKVDPPTPDEIEEALISSIDNPACSCCCKTPESVNVISRSYSPVYKYTLESFSERRQLNWDFEPYTGDAPDDPSKGSAPPAWQVPCPWQESFRNSSLTCNVPHTDYVITCLTCGGKGSKRCFVCNASGWDRCSFCLGAGYKIALHGYRDRCHECLGTGRKKCLRCTDGISICRPCGGIGQIRYFLTLTVSWTNHIDEQVTKTAAGNINAEKLLSAPASIIIEEKNPRVHPLDTFPVEEVNEISASLCKRHETLFGTEKLIMQRQKLYEIPFTRVSFIQDRRKGSRECYIYGTDNCTHFADEHTACCILM